MRKLKKGIICLALALMLILSGAIPFIGGVTKAYAKDDVTSLSEDTKVYYYSDYSGSIDYYNYLLDNTSYDIEFTYWSTYEEVLIGIQLLYEVSDQIKMLILYLRCEMDLESKSTMRIIH